MIPADTVTAPREKPLRLLALVAALASGGCYQDPTIWVEASRTDQNAGLSVIACTPDKGDADCLGSGKQSPVFEGPTATASAASVGFDVRPDIPTLRVMLQRTNVTPACRRVDVDTAGPMVRLDVDVGTLAVTCSDPARCRGEASCSP